MKIRSITCFFDPGGIKPDHTLEMLSNLARESRTVCQENGYEVQTLRLATTPFSYNQTNLQTDQILKHASSMETKANLSGFDYLSLGPALIQNPEILTLEFTGQGIRHPHQTEWGTKGAVTAHARFECGEFLLNSFPGDCDQLFQQHCKFGLAGPVEKIVP